MTTCSLCGSLDFTQLFSEESRQLSSLSQDISVLYEENSSLVAKIKTLNLELEEFDNLTNSYDDTQDVENFRDEKALWIAREDICCGQLWPSSSAISAKMSITTSLSIVLTALMCLANCGDTAHSDGSQHLHH